MRLEIRGRWAAATLAAAALLAGCGSGSGDAGAAGPQALEAQSAVVTQAITDAAAIRFLEQASFGPTPLDIAHVKSVGFDGWLNEQFAVVPTPLARTVSDKTSFESVQAGFFKNAVTGKDQLRQRVAFALWQIMVVSHAKVDSVVGLVNYHNVLANDAFGNWRQLIKDVTLSPAMGTYLDMANNVKSDPQAGTNPNENYAREILQLFSVGLVQLNPDGTPVLDSGGKPVATYSQEAVEGFAHVFTGWTYAGGRQRRRGGGGSLNPPSYSGPLQPVDAYHEPGTKELLNGVTVSMPMVAELDAALDNIFQHPNVGPFVGTRLIQALVKSNPSPAYVQRVSAAFANNGSGVRGDMKAVIRAVLLDPEARAGDTQAAGGSDGKLREPVLYMTRLMRAFSASTGGAGLAYYAQNMRQDVFDSPSVFNFYPPSYKPQGSTLYGPEFKLLNSPTSAARLNFAYDMTNGGLPGRPTFTFTPLLTAAAIDNATLINTLDATLLHGTMPSGLRSTLASALTASGGGAQERAMLGLYLVAASPAFNIQR